MALIKACPFGQMITAPGGTPFVSHLPFLLEHRGSKLRLLGHMARANPQWRHSESLPEVLVVLNGPHAYVSPSWYVSPGVPTRNYAVVHLRGMARLMSETG